MARHNMKLGASCIYLLVFVVTVRTFQVSNQTPRSRYPNPNDFIRLSDILIHCRYRLPFSSHSIIKTTSNPNDIIRQSTVSPHFLSTTPSHAKTSLGSTRTTLRKYFFLPHKILPDSLSLFLSFLQAPSPPPLRFFAPKKIP